MLRSVYKMCTETSAKDLFKMAKFLHHPQSGKEPNYENAIKLYLQAAIADTQMGEIYSESYYQAGICSEALKDTEKAFEYFLTAARVRDAIPNALNKVGVYYYNGQSPAEQNYDMAFKFFNRAATKDSVQGFYNTGLCHYKKLITNSSDSEAFRCLSIASQKGHITATRLLGLCYENGKGTEADIDKAYECMEKIGDENCYAALWIGNYFKNKGELKNSLTSISRPSQIFLTVETVALLFLPLVILLIVDWVMPEIVASLFKVMPFSSTNSIIRFLRASPTVIRKPH